MSSLKLEFPVLVRVIKEENEKSYQISPLFLQKPGIKNGRFEKAIRNFKNQIRNELRELRLDRENMNSVLWYLFNPDIHFEIIHLDFLSGKFSVNGEFSIAWFELKEQTFICLPGFDKFMFIAVKNGNEKINIKEQASEIIKIKMNQERKKHGEQWNPKNYTVSKSEFLTVIDLDVFIKHADFAFDQDINSLFSFMFNNNEPMYGDDEIEKVGSDMNLLFPDELNRAMYRDELAERIYQIIYQEEKTAIVLVGAPGSGKTTLIHEAIYKYLEKNDGKQFSFLEKIWDVDPVRVISGMKIVGMWQKRFELIIQYAITRLNSDFNHKGQDKLFVRNMVALLRVGKSSQNNMTLCDVLKTFLEKRKITLIGEATLEEWKVVQELDRKFADLFQVIRIPEMPHNDSVKVVISERARLEHENHCRISNIALSEIFNLQRIYMKQSALPGNVVNFLKRITTKYRNQEINKTEVLKTFQEVNTVSLQMLDRSERLVNQQVEDFIRKHLIGQEEAISCMIETIHLIKSNLNNPEKPYGVFLFIGPTGVGKTEAAKILAKYLFENENQLVRFDMNEYIDYEATRRLVGDVFYPEGQLTGKIRNQPFCILLFDEIEKAHYTVHNLLLQILGEGRLTDAIGRTVDFTNTVIIMTSNLGAKDAGKMVGFHHNPESITSTFRKAVENFFAPEFINRIDRIVPFKHLELKDIITITRLQIEKLMQRDGFVRRNMILNISENVLDKIAKQGFDVNYGARALKRAIEKNLVALTADQIVSVPSGKPMIFEIFSSKGQIIPKVSVLDEVDSNKDFDVNIVPEEKSILVFLENLLKDVENIGTNFSNMFDTKEELTENVSIENWGFYNLKTHLMDVKNELFEAISDYKTSKSKPVVITSPAKNYTRLRWRGYGTTINFKDLFAQMDIREYLYETFQKATLIFKDTKSHYLKYFLNVAYLKFFSDKISEFYVDNVCISLIPLSLGNNSRKKEIEYLESFYRKILSIFDFPDKSGNQNYIFSQGIRLYDLLKNENGIHMFFVPHENSIPIQVKVDKIPDEIDTEDYISFTENKSQENLFKFESGNITTEEFFKDYGKIIRYYCIPYGEFTNDTITDLRTGMIMRSQLNEDEIRLLLLSGLKDKQDNA